MIHVGISGPIAAGKSTLAKQLVHAAMENGYGATIIPFATGVKELAALEFVDNRVAVITNKLFDWGYSYICARSAATLIDYFMNKYPSEPNVKNRRLLQSIGTEVGRTILGEDTWIKRTQQIMRGGIYDFVFSDDVRFDNEVMAVDVHVGITITGPGVIAYHQRLQKLGTHYTYSDHSSERSITLVPLYTIPVDFDSTQVYTLFDQLNRIRYLRYET